MLIALADGVPDGGADGVDVVTMLIWVLAVVFLFRFNKHLLEK